MNVIFKKKTILIKWYSCIKWFHIYFIYSVYNNHIYILHRLNVDMDMNVQTLPVATHLPPGYLSIQPLGLGKGVKILLLSMWKNNNYLQLLFLKF